MSKYVLVEALAQYRMRYVIEVPDNHNDGEYPCSAIQWAEDSVVCEDAKEFSQKWLGETIIGSREVTLDQVFELINEDNDYVNGKHGNPWTDEQKINTFVTPVGYKRDW